MRKKKTKAQQERDKQVRRLKSIVRRAEKAGLVFDTSPIPENATAKRLSKITGADIRKQGYRFTPEGAKDYYTPYKERQRGVQKAKETIAQKRVNPAYNEMYLAERKMASAVSAHKKAMTAQKSAISDADDARKKRAVFGQKVGGQNYTEFIDKRQLERLLKEKPQEGQKLAKSLGIKIDENGHVTVPDFNEKQYKLFLDFLDRSLEMAESIEELSSTREKRKVEERLEANRKYEEAKKRYEEDTDSEPDYSDYYESFLDFAPTPFNPTDYNYKYAFSPEGLEARWTQSYREEFNEGIERKIADSDYEQFHGIVFDAETGEPVARYNPQDDSYSPFDYRQDELYGNRKTGEVYGTFVDMFSYEILDKLDSGIYTLQGEYILDEHGQPIATLEAVKTLSDSSRSFERTGIKLEPYEPPVFKDIADYNLDDYISSFSPNMESALRDFYDDISDDEDEIKNLGDRLQEVHYAYERVINYSSYEELLTGYYEMAEAIKGEPLTDEERAKLEQAVNDDRVKRTRRKKKRTKKK